MPLNVYRALGIPRLSEIAFCRLPYRTWVSMSNPRQIYLWPKTNWRVQLKNFQVWPFLNLIFQSFSDPSEIRQHRWSVQPRESPTGDSLLWKRTWKWGIVLHATSSFTYVSVIHGVRVELATKRWADTAHGWHFDNSLWMASGLEHVCDRFEETLCYPPFSFEYQSTVGNHHTAIAEKKSEQKKKGNAKIDTPQGIDSMSCLLKLYKIPVR